MVVPVSLVNTFAVANYRSLCDVVLPLGQLNIVSGDNGSGKSNLYRALRLLAETASGGVTAALAREGGLTSALWAGLKSQAGVPASGLRLGFSTEALSYCIDFGYAIPAASVFDHDPEIKSEHIWTGPSIRPSSILIERRGQVVRTRQASGKWDDAVIKIDPFESMLTHLADPERAPEVFKVREFMRSWRFYDYLSIEPGSPVRQPHLATRTPVLSNTGGDLASALQTIYEIGDADALDRTIEDAFPGSALSITQLHHHLTFSLKRPELIRPLTAAELSDGTLRFLLWTAALLTPRPGALTVLNEPETSLHPTLVPPLGRLIANAASRSQLLIVTHSIRLMETLEEANGESIKLENKSGETIIGNQGRLDRPSWHWPRR